MFWVVGVGYWVLGIGRFSAGSPLAEGLGPVPVSGPLIVADDRFERGAGPVPYGQS